MEPHVVLGFDSRLARRLFASHFGEHNVAVEAHGNSLAAAAFLQGLATADLAPDSWTPTKRVASSSWPSGRSGEGTGAGLGRRAVAGTAAAGGRARLPPRRRRSLDPWHLMIDPEIFAGQIETLARDWTPMSLAELVEGVGGGAA